VASTGKKPSRQRAPESKAFAESMRSNWADPARTPAAPATWVGHTKNRRMQLVASLEGLPDNALLIIPAGAPKQRSNDTDYPYRAHTAFTYFTGWGSQTTPGSILTIDTSRDVVRTTLYARGPAGRDTDEFYANAERGEFWTGPRPHLDDIEATLGITTRSLDEWSGVDADDLPRAVFIDDADPLNYLEITQYRVDTLGQQRADDLREADQLLGQIVSELRFVKDDYEIAELSAAIDATHRGFNDIIDSLPRAVDESRGERVVEGAFQARARLEGHDVGYGTIAASGSHACILHWVKNDGPVSSGDLLLVDAGVEMDSLYTADITRTLPVSGEFSPQQKLVYEAVLDAADTAMSIVKPGIAFREIHDAAMAVIAGYIDSWGFLPVSLDVALSSEGGQHRRYMIHGTSHHLGLDVHDCARARRELYVDQELKPGMVFTIEPGLYFQPDDLSVPEAWRGIGVRIEDNIVVTKTGYENLSAAIPRSVTEVEAWMRRG